MRSAKKAVLALVSLALVTLASVTVMPFGVAQYVSSVSGEITFDTVWTEANSPYTLTGNMLVHSGVTLTIEQGVTVNLNKYYIWVNGTLRVIGSSYRKMTINAVNDGYIELKSSSTDWNEETQDGCIIENAVLNCAIKTSDSSPKINANFIKGRIEVTGGAPVISNNSIAGDGTTFNFYDGIKLDGNCAAYVTDNTISHTWSGVRIAGQGTAIIGRNRLTKNLNGIQVTSTATPVISHNTIAENSWGIYMTYFSPDMYFSWNNIQNNTVYNISLENSQLFEDIDVYSNWWGTTDTSAINQTIFDHKNDFNIGTVNFVPFLTEPDSEAPSWNPSPSDSPSPTATATSQPTNPPLTQTPTPTNSALPTATPPTTSATPNPTLTTPPPASPISSMPVVPEQSREPVANPALAPATIAALVVAGVAIALAALVLVKLTKRNNRKETKM